MLHLVNPQFFNFRDKKDENYTKLQLSALDGRYIATIVSDANEDQMIDHNYVNVRTKVNEDGSIGAAIYATSRNMYDGTAIMVALPYNGYLIPYNFSGLRIRSAYAAKYTGNTTTMTQWPANMRLVEATNLPELVEGETNILYLLLEPNTNALFNPDHAHHVEQMYISFNYAAFDEEQDKITVNEHFEISLAVSAYPANGSKRGELTVEAKRAKNRMAPQIMSNLRSKVVSLKNEVDVLNIPYKIVDPNAEKGADRKDKRCSDRKPAHSDNARGKYQKREYSNDRQKRPYNNDRGGYKKNDRGSGKRRGTIHY